MSGQASVAAGCRAGLGVVFLAMAAGCSGGSAGGGAPALGEGAGREGGAPVTAEPTVTTVINDGEPAWGGKATLVEDLSIGVEVGADEYMLGGVSSIHATDELVFIVDGQIPAVRAYDLEGLYVRTYGTAGQGPGEYLGPVLVATDRDGRVFVFDLRQRRLLAYEPGGEPIATWTVDRPRCCAWRMVVASDGVLWLPVMRGYGTEETYGAQPHTIAGPAGPTRWMPEVEYERVTYEVGGRVSDDGPYAPGLAFGLTAGGGLVFGTSDRYRYEVRRPDGSALVVEKRQDPVPVFPEEADWYRRWMIANVRTYVQAGWSGDSLHVPDRKPYFRTLVPAMTGETWVIRDLESERVSGDCVEDPLSADPLTARDSSCWRHDRVVDVFDVDGRYLGPVDLPDGIGRFPSQLDLLIRGQTVYAAVEDEAGTTRVKRFRLVPPGGG